MEGACYLVRDLVVTPRAFLGAALWKIGPHANFWGAALFGAAGTVIYLLTTRTNSLTPLQRTA